MNFNDPDNITSGYGSSGLEKHMAMYATQTDRLVNALSAATAQLTSRTAEEAAKRYMDPTLRLGVAAGARILGGHDPQRLMGGISNALGGAMPYFQMQGGPGGTAVTRGGLTDVFAKNVFDHIQKNYFNYMGIGQMSKTYGMSVGQMGDVFNVMGQRGMMAGINAGVVSGSPDTRLNVETSKKTFDQIDKQFKQTAQVLGVVKKMFGSNGSITELATIAEQTTGMTMGPNGLGAILNRLQSINSFARIAGVNVTTASQIIGASAQSVSGQFQPSMARSLAIGATESSGIAFRQFQAMSALGAQRGDYFAPRDIQKLQQTETTMRGKLLEENPMLAESLYVLQNVKTLNPQQAQGLQAAVAQFRKAATREEQGAASAAMRSAIEKATGAQAGSFIKALGGLDELTNALSPEAQMTLSSTLGQNLSNRGVNELSRMARQTNMGKRMFGGAISSDNLGQAGMALLGGLNANTRDELLKHLEAGDKQSALKLLESKSDLFKEGGYTKGQGVLTQMLKGDPAKAAAFIREMQLSGLTLPTMQTTTSIEDQRAKKALDAQKRMTAIFDTAMIEQPGTIENVIRNTLGQNQIGNEEVMRYLKAAGGAEIENFNLEDLGQNPEDARRLAGVMGSYGVDLYKKFNIKAGDAASLAAAIKGDTSKLYGIMADAGITGAQIGKGKVGIANKKAADEATKTLQQHQNAATELALEGITSDNPEYDKLLKEKAAAIGKFEEESKTAKEPNVLAFNRQKELADKFANVYSDKNKVKDALKEDSTRFQDLLKLSKQNPELLDPMFKAAESKIKSDPRLKQKDKDEQLKELKELQNKLKEAKSNKMLGIVKMQADKSLVMQLFGEKLDAEGATD